MGGTRILSAARLSDGMVEIEARHNGEILRRRYPCAANCLWDDKLRVDATAGVPDRGPWILRYKATINISAPAAADKPIPSATGILGAYGDIVNHNHGTFYVSWYPGCKLAQSCDNDGRRLHDRVHTWFLPRWIKRLTANHPAAAEAVTSITHRHFVATNIRAMAAYVPALACLLRVPRRCKLGGGVILARGATDIDDPDSYLHQRSVIGPRAYGSYVTVDTGKYCTAPLFALQTADLMECML